MPARDRRLLVALALLSSVALMLEALGALTPTLLFAAPLLLMLLPLLAGRYVGEERLARLAAARRRPRARPARAILPTGRGAAVYVPRGGRLIAASLAVRPPPAPVALS